MPAWGVDLTGLSFLGSPGLSHLIEASAAIDVLRVVAANSPRRAIQTTGLGMLFRIAETVDEALG
jgi:anti-anti-sigma regulatory factor